MKRLRWVLRIACAAVLLASGTVVLLVLFTPLPERVAEHLLRRELARTGGRLTVGQRLGSLHSGLDLVGVELSLPSGTSLQARRVHLRLGRGALLAGTVQVKDLVLDGPLVVVAMPEGKEPRAPREVAELPPWLRVSAPRVRIVSGRLEIRRAGAEPLVFSAIDGRLDVSCFLQRIGLRLESLGLTPPAPAPAHVDVSGAVDLSPDWAGRFDLSLASPHSKLRGRGSWKPGQPGGLTYHARVEAAPLDLPEVRPLWPGAPDLSLSGTVDANGDASSLRYDAELRAEGAGAVAARGTVSLERGRWKAEGEARTPGLRLDRLTRAEAFRGAVPSGTARWSSRGRGDVAERWKAEATFGPSTVRGLRIEGARLQGEGSGARFHVEGSLDSAISGPVEARLEWDGAGRWRLAAAGPRVPLDDLLRATHLEPGLPRGIVLPSGAWAASRLDLEFRDGAFTLGAEVRDPAGGRWTVDAGPIRGAQVQEATLRFADLDPAQYGLGPPGRLSGTARYSGRGFTSGTLALAMESATWAGITANPFTADVRFTAKGMELAPMDLETSAGHLSAGGTFTREGGLDAAVSLRVPDASALRAILGEGLPAGAVEASLQLGGTTASPRIRGHAVVTNASRAGLRAGEARLEGLWCPGGASDLALSWRDVSFRDDPVGSGRASLKGPLQDVALDVQAEAGPGRAVALEAAGTLGLEGGDLRLSGGRLEAEGRTFLQQGEARLTWRKGSAALAGLALAKGKARLSLSASLGLGVPFDAAPIAGSLRAAGLPLALLPLPRTAGSIRAFLDADLSWSGTAGSPVLHGSMEVKDGSYLFADSDRLISPITLSLRAEGDRLTLTSARAEAPGGGEATGSGSVRFHGFLPSEFDLALQGRDFPLLLGRDVEGTIDFAATLKGTPLKPVLDGSAKVKKGRIQLPETERQQALPDTVRFVNVPESSPYKPRPAGEASAVGPLRGKFRLTSDGGLWVSSRNLLAELAGSVLVRFTPRGPTLEGGLEVVEGRFLFQGRRFELSDSRLSFSGTPDLVPYLAVKATYITEDAEVTVNLEGPANAPQLRLSSVPPMEQQDILSELVYGHRAQDMSTGDYRASTASGAGAVALYGSGPALDSVKSALGLDAMEVGVGTGTQVSFSKYVNDNTVLQYQQTFGSLPEWRADLRYRVNRAWSVQTESNSKGTSGIDLFWEHRY